MALTPGKRATWNSSEVSGRPLLQLIAEIGVVNKSDHKVALVSAKLRKPAVDGFVHVEDRASGTTGAYPLDPNVKTKASVYFYVLMPAPPVGTNVVGDVGIIDQYGNTHWLEKVRFLWTRSPERSANEPAPRAG
jgi:hypothetical protein